MPNFVARGGHKASLDGKKKCQEPFRVLHRTRHLDIRIQRFNKIPDTFL